MTFHEIYWPIRTKITTLPPIRIARKWSLISSRYGYLLHFLSFFPELFRSNHEIINEKILRHFAPPINKTTCMVSFGQNLRKIVWAARFFWGKNQDSYPFSAGKNRGASRRKSIFIYPPLKLKHRRWVPLTTPPSRFGGGGSTITSPSPICVPAKPIPALGLYLDMDLRRAGSFYSGWRLRQADHIFPQLGQCSGRLWAMCPSNEPDSGAVSPSQVIIFAFGRSAEVCLKLIESEH